MPVVTVGSLLISMVAVGIAAHTKLQQRESRELRKLAQELKDIRESAEDIPIELRNHRNHMDLEGNIQDIVKELLTCKHDTDSEIAQVNVSFYTFVEKGDETNTVEIETKKDLEQKYKSDDFVNIDVKIGNKEEIYISDRTIPLYNPIKFTNSTYDSIDKIEEQHADKLEEFDSDLLVDLRNSLDEIVENMSEHLIKNCEWFSVDLEEFETTDEIEEYIFKHIFYYYGIEEDLDELEELTEEIEELRKGILQASYS